MSAAKRKITKKIAAKGGLFAKKKAKRAKTTLPVGVKDYQVLLSPVITEKSALASTQSNTVVFRIDPRVTKSDVREAIQRIFNVEVIAVRTCNYMGKIKRTRASVGRRSGYKKAYVSLKAGQTIDVVEGI